jgi:TolB-like protein
MGGMGEVFSAMDTRLRRTVAIKLLAGGDSDGSTRMQRFLKEARAASALNHPNIVLIHDIGKHDDADFLVMEYVEGKTLKELVAEGPLPIELVLELGAQIASALDAAHAAGVVHRDIKPANVMVTQQHQVKVLDFGIAKMMDGTAATTTDDAETVSHETQVGTILGTYSYMSPEQTRGEAVDGRSDIFSLGCVLYEAATGELPFTGRSTIELMHAIATATPVAPSRVRAGLPEAFDRLVAKCLEKDAQKRPRRAEDVAEGLRAIGSTVRGREITRVALDHRRTVAVVPLQFRAGADEDKFLCVALADAIANRLGAEPTLVVRPTASVMKYAGKETDWTQVARELNVDLVVEGSIQKVGTRVRTLIEICEFRDERTLHSLKVDGEIAELFDFQDRISESVFSALSPRGKEKPTGAPATPASPHPLAAELYLRAVDRGMRFNKYELASAIEMLERAVDLDPEFADAWGTLSFFCYHMGAHIDSDPQWFMRAEKAVTRTLELDPVNSDAFCARGMILWSPARGFQLRAGLVALNAAIKISPSRALARTHRSAVLFHIGFHEASIVDFQEAVLANPTAALPYVGVAMSHCYCGNYAISEELNERALAMEPGLVHANIMAPVPSLYAGNLEKARGKLRQARQMIPGEPQLDAIEGMLLAHEGNYAGAEEFADRAVAQQRSLLHAHHAWHCAACAYALCGKPEKAITQIKRCVEQGLPNHRAFQKDPFLRSLHDQPEFEALMRDLRRDYETFRRDFQLNEPAD